MNIKEAYFENKLYCHE